MRFEATHSGLSKVEAFAQKHGLDVVEVDASRRGGNPFGDDSLIQRGLWCHTHLLLAA
jgi:hypothetical protein